MAGTKISQLPTATTPLTGAELVPVVQSSSTYQTTAQGVANLAALPLAASGGSSLVGFLQDGTGAVARTVQSKERDTVSVKDFGAVGDGVTDDTAAFSAALTAAAGKRLYAPAGTYKLAIASGTLFTPAANTAIDGDGREATTLVFTPSTTTFSTLFNLTNAGFTLSNIKVTASVPSGGIVEFFRQASNNISIVNCYLDGAVTWTGSAVSHTAYGFIAPETTYNADNMLVDRCVLTRFTYPYLKSNTAVTTQTRMKWVNNKFTGNFYNDLGLNSPLGICDDVVIAGNSFGNNQSIGTVGATQALGVALASVTNFKISGNTFNDNYTDAIHIEEGSYYGSVGGNTAYVNGTALNFIGNNISGTIKSPTNISVSGNTFNKSGTLKSAGSNGIQCVQNAFGHLPAYNLQITGNVITGFNRGFYGSSTLDDSVSLTSNLFYQCAIGISVQDAACDIAGNTSNQCDIGVAGVTAGYLYESGCIADHTFINCTTNVDSIDLPMTLLNPKFVFPEFSHAGGVSVYMACLPTGANDRVNGFLEITEDCNAALNYSRIRDEVNWDGATFTRTNKLLIQPGAVTTQAANNAGSLSVQVFSAASRTNVRVQARLNGMAVVAA